MLADGGVSLLAVFMDVGDVLIKIDEIQFIVQGKTNIIAFHRICY